jgi:hypothetical protein
MAQFHDMTFRTPQLRFKAALCQNFLVLLCHLSLECHDLSKRLEDTFVRAITRIQRKAILSQFSIPASVRDLKGLMAYNHSHEMGLSFDDKRKLVIRGVVDKWEKEGRAGHLVH